MSGSPRSGSPRSPRSGAADPDSIHWVPLAGRGLQSKDLIEQAWSSLRCIDWPNITLSLLNSAKQNVEADGDAKDISRPVDCQRNEGIDFFMSHSWHDDAKAKFAILDLVMQQFKAKYNREATFWLDKVCIDQENLSDGLRVLCINVTACKKLLVVCGKTYFQRLWCMLELFIMLAFSQNEADVVSRIELVPIEADGVTRESILESMSTFELERAHCYDPNEEIKLRSVMAAVGEEQFVARMRSLAEKIRAADVVKAAREEAGSEGGVSVLGRIKSMGRSFKARD